MLAVFSNNMYLWIALGVIAILVLAYFMRDQSRGNHRR